MIELMVSDEPFQVRLRLPPGVRYVLVNAGVVCDAAVVLVPTDVGTELLDAGTLLVVGVDCAVVEDVGPGCAEVEIEVEVDDCVAVSEGAVDAALPEP